MADDTHTTKELKCHQCGQLIGQMALSVEHTGLVVIEAVRCNSCLYSLGNVIYEPGRIELRNADLSHWSKLPD